MPDYGYLADFHTHTNAMHDRGNARDLYRLASEWRVSAVAVTDHNSLDGARWCYGFARHQKAVACPGPQMVAGVELSSYIASDEGADVVCVLGLGIDPFADKLSALCDELQGPSPIRLERSPAHTIEAKGRRRRRVCDFWEKDEAGHEALPTDRLTMSDASLCGHAVDRVIDDGPSVRVERAIAAIHDAGGIAVLAHPLRGKTPDKTCDLTRAIWRIDALAAMGLDGVECYHRALSLEACETLDAVTRARRLLVSCGSDHHLGHAMCLGVTCADGRNYAYRTDVADALGIT